MMIRRRRDEEKENRDDKYYFEDKNSYMNMEDRCRNTAIFFIRKKSYTVLKILNFILK